MKRIGSLVFIMSTLAAIAFAKEDYAKFIKKKHPEKQGYFQRFLARFQQQPFNGSYALIIAVGDYDKLKRLQAPKRDAEKLKNALLSTGDYDEVAMLCDADASSDNIHYFMETYFPRKMKEGGRHRFLFYFSGHGTQLEGQGGRQFGGLLLKGATTGDVDDSEMIDMEYLQTSSKRFRNAAHMLFLLDCCFSGLAGVESKGIEYNANADPLVLAQENGHFMITAGQANQESFADMSRWNGSLFTDAVIEGMKGKADDKYQGDGVVTTYELFEYVRWAVENEAQKAGKTQRPVLHNFGAEYKDTGQYFFVYKDINRSPNVTVVSEANLERKNAHEKTSAQTLVPITESPTTSLAPVRVATPITPSCWSKNTPGATCTEEMTGMEFVYMLGGCFMMGSPENEKYRSENETQHRVCVHDSGGFWMGKYEVTQAQWEAVMKNNPSYFHGATLPVESVSWNDTQAFLQSLNEMGETEGSPSLPFRLPSEAEWEYAARAGRQTAYSFGNDSRRFNDYAWYIGNSEEKTHPVGQKQPNDFGLYDMHGNVWEWNQDTYVSYSDTPTDGSAYGHVDDDSAKVMRGGAWNLIPLDSRCASRVNNNPTFKFSTLGFRIVRSQ